MHNVAFSTIRRPIPFKWLCPLPYKHFGIQTIRSCDLRKPNSQHHGLLQRRGAKTVATARLDELPCRSVKSADILPEFENVGPAYPTMVLQARNNMRKFENCVLLTRVGSFYEVNPVIRYHIHLSRADKNSSTLSMQRSMDRF